VGRLGRDWTTHRTAALAVAIAGANVPDAQLLEATIDAIVLERPEPEPDFLSLNRPPL
jgi:hypothetical protein